MALTSGGPQTLEAAAPEEPSGPAFVARVTATEQKVDTVTVKVETMATQMDTIKNMMQQLLIT